MKAQTALTSREDTSKRRWSTGSFTVKNCLVEVIFNVVTDYKLSQVM